MTTNQKTEIANRAAQKGETLGSLAAVAQVCQVSTATISQMINQKWDLISDKMWRKVGAALGWKQEGWQVVETTNTKLLYNVFEDAKAGSLFMMVSHKAGSGKTTSGRTYAETNARNAVYFIQAREWSRRQFLVQLCRTLGISTGPGYSTTEDMISLVCDFFHQRTDHRPLLILDEADKLKADALRVLIPLYNELEDRIGMVMMGTDNLKRTIKIGVQWNKKGFDEIHSRFGARFINLYGARWADVKMICEANGIHDNATQKAIWKDASPKQHNVNGTFVQMVEDMRRIKRSVQRELIKLKYNESTASSV
jgi:hypothetical protein